MKASRKINLDKLEQDLKEQLKNNPKLLLPGAHNITIAEKKYTQYLFGGTNQGGLIKGKLITSELGYGISNYKEFDGKIKQAVMEFPAKYKSTIEFGDIYEINSVIAGLKDKKARVIIGALVDRETSKVTSIYIKDVKGG